MWHLQGNENEVSHVGLGNKAGGKKRCALFHPAFIPEGLKDELKRKSWQLLQIIKWEQQYGFGQTSQLYLSSEYFLHRGTLTYIKELDFFPPPLRQEINDLHRNPNLSRITKENEKCFEDWRSFWASSISRALSVNCMQKKIGDHNWENTCYKEVL